MSQGTTMALGALAGLTILLGLPIARMRRISSGFKGFFNALATGILIFLLWDVITKANQPIGRALEGLHQGQLANFLVLMVAFVSGIGIGLLGLVYFNRFVGTLVRPRLEAPSGPGAAVAAGTAIRAVPAGRSLAMMIAIGLGLHNFSEGLAIGQASATGAISFAAVLIVGFGLHNMTEGFGIAAPLTGDPEPPSWGFLLLAGLVGGGPTFLGTAIGYSVTSTYFYVLFLTLAAGALIYVIGEMFGVGRRMNRPRVLAWGILSGFLLAYSTDLVLTYVGG